MEDRTRTRTRIIEKKTQILLTLQDQLGRALSVKTFSVSIESRSLCVKNQGLAMCVTGCVRTRQTPECGRLTSLSMLGVHARAPHPCLVAARESAPLASCWAREDLGPHDIFLVILGRPPDVRECRPWTPFLEGPHRPSLCSWHSSRGPRLTPGVVARF